MKVHSKITRQYYENLQSSLYGFQSKVSLGVSMGYCLNCKFLVNKGFVYCSLSKMIRKWVWVQYENNCDKFQKKDWTLPEHMPSVFIEIEKKKKELLEQIWKIQQKF